MGFISNAVRNYLLSPAVAGPPEPPQNPSVIQWQMLSSNARRRWTDAIESHPNRGRSLSADFAAWHSLGATPAEVSAWGHLLRSGAAGTDTAIESPPEFARAWKERGFQTPGEVPKISLTLFDKWTAAAGTKRLATAEIARWQALLNWRTDIGTMTDALALRKQGESPDELAWSGLSPEWKRHNLDFSVVPLLRQLSWHDPNEIRVEWMKAASRCPGLTVEAIRHWCETSVSVSEAVELETLGLNGLYRKVSGIHRESRLPWSEVYKHRKFLVEFAFRSGSRRLLEDGLDLVGQDSDWPVNMLASERARWAVCYGANGRALASLTAGTGMDNGIGLEGFLAERGYQLNEEAVSVDLHGYSVRLAGQIVDDVVASAAKGRIESLRFVTGRPGPDGKPRPLREVVMRHLEDATHVEDIGDDPGLPFVTAHLVNASGQRLALADIFFKLPAPDRGNQ